MEEHCKHCDKAPSEGEPFQQCARCKNARYCSTDCQRAAWKDHKGSCEIPGISTSGKAATTLDPMKCGACTKDSNLLCDGCGNQGYCSKVCQTSDKPLHKVVCDSFKSLPPRPGPNFYRAIFFPVDTTAPHFVWLEFEGCRTWMRMTEGEQKKYLGGGDIRSLYDTRDVGLARDFAHQFEIHHRENFVHDGSTVNMSLSPFMNAGIDRLHWLGPFLAQGGKYHHMELDFDKIEKVDYDSDCDSVSELEEIPMIPMDLDTTSFGPIIRYMRHAAQRERASRASILSGHFLMTPFTFEPI